MRSPGIYTWEGDGEACHEFHAVAIIVRKKYEKFLNTIVQVSLFPTVYLKTRYYFLCLGKLIIPCTTYQDVRLNKIERHFHNVHVRFIQIKKFTNKTVCKLELRKSGSNPRNM